MSFQIQSYYPRSVIMDRFEPADGLEVVELFMFSRADALIVPPNSLTLLIGRNFQSLMPYYPTIDWEVVIFPLSEVLSSDIVSAHICNTPYDNQSRLSLVLENFSGACLEVPHSSVLYRLSVLFKYQDFY